jgi:hypothetical protein
VPPPGVPTEEALTDFDGRWEGQIKGFHAPGLWPERTWDRDIRLTIGGDVAIVSTFVDGKWEAPFADFKIAKRHTNAIVYSIASDQRAGRTETWAFVLTHKTADVLLAYWYRVVSNFRVPPETDDARFALGASGTLTRVQPEGVDGQGKPAPSSRQHEAAVRRLLDVIGMAGTGARVLDDMFDTLRTMMPSVPPAVWDELRKSYATDELAEFQVAVYSKHFSTDEVEALTAFYQSPFGQKLLRAQPELVKEGMALGQEFARRAFERLRRQLEERGYKTVTDLLPGIECESEQRPSAASE